MAPDGSVIRPSTRTPVVQGCCAWLRSGLQSTADTITRSHFLPLQSFGKYLPPMQAPRYNSLRGRGLQPPICSQQWNKAVRIELHAVKNATHNRMSRVFLFQKLQRTHSKSLIRKESWHAISLKSIE